MSTQTKSYSVAVNVIQLDKKTSSEELNQFLAGSNFSLSSWGTELSDGTFRGFLKGKDTSERMVFLHEGVYLVRVHNLVYKSFNAESIKENWGITL